MDFNKSITILILVIILTITLLIILYPYIKNILTDNFNGSGYGFNKNFGNINTLVPLNNVSKSTDFKLFSLMSQLKYGFIQPQNNYNITFTKKGIISNTNKNKKNIILFPGLSDYILKQNSSEVWPNNFNNIDNSKKASIFNNNSGHFNSITTLLENLNYKDKSKLNTITYDFRKLDFKHILAQFKRFLKEDTIIIAYDFGCVISNICINLLTEKDKKYINKFLLICPTIGGIPMTIRDYFSGNGIINPKIIESYDSVLLSMPNQQFYNEPIVLYNSLSYTGAPENISELFKYEKKPFHLYEELLNTQSLSLNNPGVNCIIIANGQFNTPVSYNFKNDLTKPPERYFIKNNNKLPNDDIYNNDTVEGLQSKGDRIVPISNIYKLKQLWGNNCNIELIKDKDHFTILKSYELALIITSVLQN